MDHGYEGYALRVGAGYGSESYILISGHDLWEKCQECRDILLHPSEDTLFELS